MKYQFLCIHHRNELIRRPDRALLRWAESQETGLSFVEGAMYFDALPHFGSAFEIAEILLSSDQISAEQGLNLFTTSTLYLCSTLNSLQYQEQKSAFLLLAIHRLRQETKRTHLADEYANNLESQLLKAARFH